MRSLARAEDERALVEVLEDLESHPLVQSDCVDLVVSNCVLNLVEDRLKPQLFAELARVLRDSGRAVIADIVADRDVPEELKADDRLWTGCMAGALRRDRFLQAFRDAGFADVRELDAQVWREESGITFYSVTVQAGMPQALLDEPTGCC